MSTVYCTVTLREGRQCRNKIKLERLEPGKPPDCGVHEWLKQAKEELSEQQSLFDDKKLKDSNLARIAKNETRKDKSAAEKIESAAEKIESAAEKIESAAEKIESAAERNERAAALVAERFATEIPPMEEERAECDKKAQSKTRIKEVDVKNREAYPEEGQTREKQSDNADAKGRVSRARAHGKKQVKRLVVGTGRVAKRTAGRTKKWVSNTVTKENAKRLAKTMAKGALEAVREYVKYMLYTSAG